MATGARIGDVRDDWISEFSEGLTTKFVVATRRFDPLKNYIKFAFASLIAVLVTIFIASFGGAATFFAVIIGIPAGLFLIAAIVPGAFFVFPAALLRPASYTLTIGPDTLSVEKDGRAENILSLDDISSPEAFLRSRGSASNGGGPVILAGGTGPAGMAAAGAAVATGMAMDAGKAGGGAIAAMMRSSDAGLQVYFRGRPVPLVRHLSADEAAELHWRVSKVMGLDQ